MIHVQPILCLSQNGDAFKLSDCSVQEDRMHLDFLRQSSVCKNHQQVLEFLKTLKDTPMLLTQVELYHEHHSRYPTHSMQKGTMHQDSIDDMIEFVQVRIKEKSTPHAVFDRIETILGSVIGGLQKPTGIPYIGMVPAAVQVGIGITQVIVGLALSILFYLPSLASENAKVVVERSLGHIGSGVIHALDGVVQMVPPKEPSWSCALMSIACVSMAVVIACDAQNTHKATRFFLA